MSRPREAAGSALVMAVLILLVAQALVLAVTTRAILASQASARRTDETQALNAAEAGLADAVQRLLADNVATGGEGAAGLATWQVEASEELRAPSIGVATFLATSRCRDRTCRIRLRLVVRRDERLLIAEMRKLDWQRLP